MKTGIFADVPPLALGLLRLACSPEIAEPDAIALLHFAYSNGIRIFDTADCYFHSDDDLRYGEHLLRDAFSNKQDELHLITKVGLTRASAGSLTIHRGGRPRFRRRVRAHSGPGFHLGGRFL